MNVAGFHYTNNDDTVCCDLCQLEVSRWTSDMKPFAIHAQRRPKCPFVLSILSGDIVPQLSTIRFTPSATDETSRGHYQQNLLMEVNKVKLIRERTFSHWPHQTSPSAAQMIAAGFFACNIGDRVICLYCNLICQQWTPNTDDPYEVHKTLSPKCPYVVAMLEHEQAASSLPVNKIVNRSTSHSTVEHVWWFPYHAYTEQLCITELHRNLEYNSLDEELLSRLIKDRLDLTISKNLVAEGFDLSIVKSCYENQFRLTGKIKSCSHAEQRNSI